MDDDLRAQFNHAELLLKEARKHASNGMPMTTALIIAQLRTHLLIFQSTLMAAPSNKDKEHAAG